MTIDELQKASMEDLRERYGDYPVWAAIQRAYDLGVGEGFYAAAKDPSAWYVEDHGEVFKIGDMVWFGGKRYMLDGWDFICGCPGKVRASLRGRSDSTSFHRLTKIQPDSWEKLQADIANAVNSVCIGEYEAASFITRAKKLGGCDE